MVNLAVKSFIFSKGKNIGTNRNKKAFSKNKNIMIDNQQVVALNYVLP